MIKVKQLIKDRKIYQKRQRGKERMTVGYPKQQKSIIIKI